VWISSQTFFSVLGAGAAAKALIDVALPAVVGVYPDAAIVTATIAFVPAEGGVCPSMASAGPVDGSTVRKGAPCSISASSVTTTLTLCFECLGFRELALRNQERGVNSIKIIDRKVIKITYNTGQGAYLGVSSSGWQPLAFLVAWEKVTTRRARAFLGGACPLALHHIL
jgi:hypothetical protein